VAALNDAGPPPARAEQQVDDLQREHHRAEDREEPHALDQHDRDERDAQCGRREAQQRVAIPAHPANIVPSVGQFDAEALRTRRERA
jgi:hypothetical protein